MTAMPSRRSPASRLVAGMLAASACLAAPALAADAEAGRALTGQCVACHGLDGVARQPMMPNIAGSDPRYLALQLHAFKSGERQNPQMNVIASMLSDEDIENLAAWYGSLDVEVAVPE